MATPTPWSLLSTLLRTAIVASPPDPPGRGPLLKKIPPLRRALLFVPTAFAVAFVLFLVVAIASGSLPIALLLAPFGGVAGAWALLGVPRVTRKDGSPLVPPRAKPWLFFAAFPLFAAFAYPFLGLALTSVLPPAFTVYGPLALAIVVGGVGAYLVFGFPRLADDARAAWGRIPPKTKPWLSIPAGLVFSLVLYFALGWSLTSYLAATWAPLVALPVGVIAGFALAIVLFGIPKPEKPVREMVPRPPGNARPGLLLGSWLLLSPPLAFAVGVGLSFTPGFPLAYLLPTAILAGSLLAFGAAALVWGLPGRWAKLPDYTPGVSPEVRVALVVPLTVAVGAVVVIALAIADVPIFAALLAGLAVGAVAALGATGLWRSLRRLEAPRIPETVKPLLFFPLWIVATLAIFVPVTWFLPETFAWNLAGAALLGLVAAFLLVERDVLDEVRASYARKAALKREIEALRAEKLGAPRPAAAAEKAAPAAHAPAPAPEKRSLLARFQRRKGGP